MQFEQGAILPMPFPPGLASAIFKRIVLLTAVLRSKIGGGLLTPLRLLHLIDATVAQVITTTNGPSQCRHRC